MNKTLINTLTTDRRLYTVISIACLLATAGTGCDRDIPTARDTDHSLQPVFEDMARSSGLDFKHYSGVSGKYYIPEIMSSGIALLDYDWRLNGN